MSFEDQKNENVLAAPESRERFEGDHWSLESTLFLGEEVGNKVSDRLKERGWSEEEIGMFPIVVQEAVNNAVIHGNWGIQKRNYPNQHEYQAAIAERAKAEGGDEKKVTVSLQISKDERGVEGLDVTILDEGPGFSPEDIPSPIADENITKTSGRGWFLMNSLAAPELTIGKGEVILHWKKSSDPDGYRSIKEVSLPDGQSSE